ncbi:hypothetical protein HUK80_07190 [Flavobacterium sp. MAH-1]|uniref:Repeat protein (TIGR03806 family) n=1 Tax=Flavobacterium agri TaxID=2743471 RepID=A0A7Y9C6W7_9FLAO|nr:hypothetical protein [Flavobacterium agri]NUY80673.1 hypothetical protein [Flavobacterium agri]NYA70697.1 hypothetical protein [Flavobacterium agri]
MRKIYASAIAACICFVFAILSCSKSDDDGYVPVEPVSPVTVDLTQVPYPKLSDYKFFEGEMKNQIPSLNVLPYAPSSNLFADYSHKKRFVWMPTGTKATFAGDNVSLELPVGAALIKTFYYDNVQSAPVPGQTRIIETRVMIRQASGWIFADYVWNADQTEALLDLAGSVTPISWTDENGVSRNVDYRIPNEVQCKVCHKWQDSQNGGTAIQIPIGIKPQNLNFNYNYGNESKNQLTKWIEAGYLDPNFTMPSAANSTVDYSDATKPVELRVRSYFDANCSHCHMTNRHCDYRPMRFAFSETTGTNGLANMGVCVDTQDMQGFPTELGKIITPRHPEQSMLFYRVNTINETFRMPLHGRTLIHDEGVALIQEWINSLENCN